MKTIHSLSYARWFYVLFLSIISLWNLSLFGQVDVIQKEVEEVTALPIAKLANLKIWVDSFSTGSATNLKEEDFRPLPDFTLGEVTSAYWIQFSLTNPQSTPQQYRLNTSVFDSLTLVSISETDTLVQHFGLLALYDEAQKRQFRTLQKDKYGVDIWLSAHQEQQFYLRIKNVVRFESSFEEIKLYLATQYAQEPTIWALLFHAIFFGILLFLALFTFIQFFQNRDYAYWYYTLYLLLSTIYFWWKFEKSNSFINFLFTEFPEWYYYLEIPMSMAIYISYLFFVIHFINAKQEIPFIYRVLKVVSVVLFLYLLVDRVILLTVGFSFSWEIYFAFRVLFAGFGIISFYFVLKAKPKLAFYLLSGSLIILLGSCVTGYYSKSMTQHYWVGWDIPLLPIQLATLLEIIFFSIGLGYKSRLAVKERVSIKKSLELEQKEKKQEKDSKEQLSIWFTNISHEFRTPLTIIKGLTEQLMERPNFEVEKRLNIIQRNTRSLQHLVTQVLDLSKLESGVLSIQKERDNIIKYLGYLTESFHSLAFEKKINLSFYSKKNTQMMEYDAEKIRKILCNLLFNALKFTPEYGKIIVVAEVVAKEKIKEWTQQNTASNQLSIGTVQPADNYLHIIIKDSGIGIAFDKLPHVFDRFFQVAPFDKQVEGTGIGLPLTKELVLLLGGMMHVESSPNLGSTFSVFLPIVEPVIINSLETADKETNFSTDIIEQGPSSFTKQPTLINNSDKPLLLIVEDNADVIYYIKACTQETYAILEARNGKIGMDLAFEASPDLIISDVMMPIMDGYELCKTLQQDVRTSHIPFLLLTAKATQAYKKYGLEAGAFAYLIKPFEKEELLIRLQNLITWRKQIQEYLVIKPDKKQQISTNSISEVELAFFQKLNEKIYKHLDDESFKVVHLAREMAMSETQLYRKLKAIANQSIAQYIRSVRLKEAYKLLETTELSIGEIASRVGFKQLSHFSKVFQQKYEMRPSELRK